MFQIKLTLSFLILSDPVLKEVLDNNGESIAKKLWTTSYKLTGKQDYLIISAIPTFFKYKSVLENDGLEIDQLVS